MGSTGVTARGVRVMVCPQLTDLARIDLGWQTIDLDKVPNFRKLAREENHGFLRPANTGPVDAGRAPPRGNSEWSEYSN